MGCRARDRGPGRVPRILAIVEAFQKSRRLARKGRESSGNRQGIVREDHGDRERKSFVFVRASDQGHRERGTHPRDQSHGHAPAEPKMDRILQRLRRFEADRTSEENPGGISGRRGRSRQRGLDLPCDPARGNLVRGEMSQNGGGFRAEVEGRFDGVHLEIKQTRMLHGASRYIEYQGVVVGSLGELKMQGIKTDNQPTTGRIVLQLRD